MEKRSTKEILKQNLNRSVPNGVDNMMVLLHNVRSMHNVGAAFRSADAFGISSLLLSGYTPTPPRPEISKTAIGAEKHVPWEGIKNPKEKIEGLKNNGYKVVALEQTSNSMLLPDFELPTDTKICLVFGNEVTGIDDDLLPLIDDFVEVPQYGHKHSLNVSVTVGVALYAFLVKFW